MKKLLLIFFLFFAAKSFAQYPLVQGLGNDSTLIKVGQNYKGGIKGGLINMSVADTTAANLLRIKAYPGAQIFTDDGNVWVRNITATGWVLMGGGGSSPSGSFWKIGGNLFPVTAPTRDIGTLAPYGGAISLMTNGVKRLILPDAGLSYLSASTDSILVRDISGNIGLIPKSASGSYTFTNGLTESAGTVKLGGSLTENTTITAGSFSFRVANGNIQLDSTVIIGVPDESPILSSVVGINSNSNRDYFLRMWDTDNNVSRFSFARSGNIITGSGTIYDASNHTLQSSTGNFTVKTITPIVSNTQGANDLLQLAPGTSDGRVGIGVNTGADNLTDKLQLKGGLYVDATGKSVRLIGLPHTTVPDSVLVKSAGSDTTKWASVSDVSGGGGSSAGRLFKSLNANTSASGNTGSGEDNLMTYTIPADTLNTNGDQIDFTMTFTFAANANSKRVKLYYGATTIFDSGAQNQNSGSMEIRGTIVRTGATTQLISFSQNNDASSFTIRSGYTTAAETLSSTVVLKATGEGSADNDIQQILLIVKMIPNS